MTYYRQINALKASLFDGDTIDLRNKETINKDQTHNSAGLRPVGVTLTRNKEVKAQADVDIRYNVLKTRTVYTIEFRRKAIKRLGLDRGQAIMLCVLDANPDAIYIESVQRTETRQNGILTPLHHKDHYTVNVRSKEQMHLLEQFLEGEERRLYPLYRDDRMDGEHYMIKKGRQWDENRTRPYGGDDDA